MFDIGWTEMALVAVVALFVVGPKELPHLLYKLAGYWKKVRGMAREFQSGIDDIIREAELDDLRKQVNSSHSNPTDFLENKISSPKSDGKKTESKPKAEKPAEKADAPAAKSATTTGAPADDSKKKDQPESQA
ncbi:Sec-independent protein translocase protein TatB [Thalassospira sp. ER-Se-21-Dark]|uniref:Sec-independent protein translocase protein TatB n=1 Tax=Thalassospira sp. ER-Se-21-Dark TaxID=2585190 RepID=UPI001B315E2E|nr:Sec-independent protein translocase protein TatB [Thalassospira sp. ER-Se-21-Dark]MBP3126445.1 twin-arginine translocase subunit TatB [Thalassospira sp. ER-Se-21-Dark]